MQYPVYEKAQNALTIQRPPIVAVELANLIRDGNGGPLICAMNGFAFTPNAGFTPEDSPYIRFGKNNITNASTDESGKIDNSSRNDYIGFKSYNMKFDFTVLHQSPMGFQRGSKITDPDTVLTGDDMRFLGGYAFGPRKLETDQGVQVFATNKAGEQGIMDLANVADIFGDLFTGE